MSDQNSSQHIGTGIIILNEAKTHVLLGKRKNSYNAGMYGMPGGRVEVGEKVLDTAKREVLEETGLVAKNLKYVGVVKEFQKTYDFVHFTFVCLESEGEPQVMEPDKCEAWEWVDLKNLPENILPGHKAGLYLFTHPTEQSLADI
jgi:8-oxo-dGTP diphosphatase